MKKTAIMCYIFAVLFGICGLIDGRQESYILALLCLILANQYNKD